MFYLLVRILQNISISVPAIFQLVVTRGIFRFKSERRHTPSSGLIYILALPM